MRKTVRRTCLVALAAAAPMTLPDGAAAEPAVGVIAGTDIVATFDTTAPGTFTSLRPITGLQPLEHVLALDYRWLPLQTPPIPPSRLFALGVTTGAVSDSVRLLTIDPGTGVATVISSTPIALNTGSAYDMDFNPTVDRIRVVNASDVNMRINPNNGTIAGIDVALNPAGGDIAAIAYDRVNIPQPPSVSSNTTVHGISNTVAKMVTIGGVNGAPSPNGGQAFVGGALGVTLAAGSDKTTDLDVSFGGTAYATLTPSSLPIASLYTIDLTTGAATLVGPLAAPLSTFAIVRGASYIFDPASLAADESAGSATFTVTRVGAPGTTSSVDYATSDGTATAGDYQSAHGTLTFGPDDVTKSFTVPIVNDSVDEPDETVNLALSSPGAPAALGSPATATLTIADDDPAPTPPDTTKPKLTISGVKSTMYSDDVRAKGVKVSITSSEPASIKASLLGTVTTAKLHASYNLTLASKSLSLGSGKRSVTLKPSSKLFGHPKGTFKLRISVTGTDAARNVGTATKTITVKRKPKHTSSHKH